MLESLQGIHSGSKCLPRVACLWSKMPMFQRAGIEKGGLPLLQAFQYLIFMIWRACDLNLVIPTLRTCHFEVRKDIMTKFKSQALHVIRIRYWKAGGSGNLPSLIPALWNIGILLHKQATLGKHFELDCNHPIDTYLQCTYYINSKMGN